MRQRYDPQNAGFYDGDDEDAGGDEEESFDGFTIVDENGEDIPQDETALNDPDGRPGAENDAVNLLPPDKLKVILFDAAGKLPDAGAVLRVSFGEGDPGVYCGDEKIGGFKRAFIEKLKNENGGKYVKTVLESTDAPVMAVLEISDSKKRGYIKIPDGQKKART